MNRRCGASPLIEATSRAIRRRAQHVLVHASPTFSNTDSGAVPLGTGEKTLWLIRRETRRGAPDVSGRAEDRVRHSDAAPTPPAAPAPARHPAPHSRAHHPVMSIDLPATPRRDAAVRVAGWPLTRSHRRAGVNVVDVWAYPASGAAPFYVGSAQHGGSGPTWPFTGAVRQQRLRLDGRDSAGKPTARVFARSPSRHVHQRAHGNVYDPRRGAADGHRVPQLAVRRHDLHVACWAFDFRRRSGSAVDPSRWAIDPAQAPRRVCRRRQSG